MLWCGVVGVVWCGVVRCGGLWVDLLLWTGNCYNSVMSEFVD